MPISKNIKDYAQVHSPCCGALLIRPYTGRMFGRFFCAACGAPYDVIFRPGERDRAVAVPVGPGR